LQKVEATSKLLAETQQKMDEKVDAIYKLLQQWNGSEIGSGQKSHPPLNSSPTPPHNQGNYPTLSVQDLAFLKK
jgi:hypothetical protein